MRTLKLIIGEQTVRIVELLATVSVLKQEIKKLKEGSVNGESGKKRAEHKSDKNN